ncbi:MAG: polyprenol monophosphomannose synthase [Candidatus Thorarchaeota archaeon]
MTTIVVPTLNEVDNIGLLIERIYGVLDRESTAVIVVDDNSVDGTHEVVRSAAERYPNVQLIVRRHERGLGSAVRLGASQARDGPTVVMDADLSHDPCHIPSMLSRLAEGFDVVVGSRYIEGGSVIGWPGSRVAVSRVATLMARILFGLSVRDPMSGFVASRDPHLLAHGFRHGDYKFLLELIVRNRGIRVAEVPIVFRDRRRGKSKFGGRTVVRYLSLLVHLFVARVLGRE